MSDRLNGTPAVAPKTCAGCKHFGETAPDPNNLANKVGECRERPPAIQFVVLPGPMGQASLQKMSAYPLVQTQTPACGRFKALLALALTE